MNDTPENFATLTSIVLRRVVNLGDGESVTIEAYFETNQTTPVSLKKAISKLSPQLEEECEYILDRHKSRKPKRSLIERSLIEEAKFKAERLKIATQILAANRPYLSRRLISQEIFEAIEGSLKIADLVITQNNTFPVHFWREDREDEQA